MSEAALTRIFDALTEEEQLEALDFSFKHLGVNCRDAAEGRASAEFFHDAFGFDMCEIPVSFFVGSGLEILKYDGTGTKGHIAISCTSIPLAVRYLEKKGYAFDRDSVVYFEDGRIRLIYFKDEVAGFGVHLGTK